MDGWGRGYKKVGDSNWGDDPVAINSFSNTCPDNNHKTKQSRNHNQTAVQYT